MKKNNRLLAVICLLLLTNLAYTQPCDVTPPDGLDCSTAIHMCGNELNGFISTLPEENTGSNPNDQLCFNSENDGGMVNNIHWFSFIACESYVEITITPDNCTVSNALTGLQAGIYSDCSFDQNMVCVVDCFDSETTLASSGFIPNEKYYLFVDGCNGSVCDYRIDVISGIDTSPISLETENSQAHQIIGELAPCLSSVVNYTYSVPECNVIGGCVDYNPFELGLACYEWTIPPGATIIGEPNGPTVEIEFSETGNFQIGVQLYLDPSIISCAGGTGDCGFVAPININVSLPNYEVLDPIYFCPGDSVHFCGQYYTTPQDIICENPLDGCSAQLQTIAYWQEVEEDLGVFSLCEGECVTVNGMQFCNPNIYEIPKNECDTVLRFEIEHITYEVDIFGIEMITCDKPQIHLEAEASFPGAQFDFIWRDENDAIVGTGPTALILQGGDYTVEAIAEKNGTTCIEFVEFTVDEDSNVPSFSIAAGDIDCNNQQVEIDFQTSSSNIVSYSWSGPSNFVSDIPNPIINVAGEYELTVTSDNGCTLSQVVNVIENMNPPVLDWNSPTLNCLNPVASMFVQSDIPLSEYQWIAPDGTPGSGMELLVDQTGSYAITAIGTNGCATDFSVDVLGDFDLPEAIVANPVINCFEPEVRLEYETDYTIVRQTWTTPIGENFNDPFIDITVGGMYTLELEADNGCVNTFMIDVLEDNINPVIEAGSDLFWNCNTENIMLDASIEQGDLEVQWKTSNGILVSDDNAYNPVIGGPGSYILEVYNPISGCLSSDTLEVQINPNVPSDAIISKLDPQCYGEPSGLIEIEQVVGGVPPFSIYVNGQSMGNDMVMPDYMAGIYEIEIRDANECIYLTSVELADPLEIIVTLDDRIQVQYGDNAVIEAEYNISDEEVMNIDWVDEDNFLLGSGKQLSYQPSKSENVTAILTSIDGCEVFEDIRVNLRKSIDVFGPNAFTPNNDGVNDTWTLFGRNDLGFVKNLNIFDRWGNTVYAATDLQFNDESEGWDGSFANQKLMPGVYVYNATVVILDGTEFNFKGSITLVR